ncbi:hypothetical protein ACS0TY_030295 [Phlomoides rotata]
MLQHYTRQSKHEVEKLHNFCGGDVINDYFLMLYVVALLQFSVNNNGRKLSRKRARAPPIEEMERDFPCPQCGVGCDRAFCGAYWHAMGITHFGAYPVCSHETLKPIGVRSVTRMPFLAHEKNRHEQDITETCIRHMGRSLQDLISEWIRKLSSREVDRTRLQLNHSETITPQTFVCR